jgi:Ca2+-binding EF-hand superfamily protein
MHTKKSFDEADIDHDGTLDRDEAKTVCNEEFDFMDKDHDGTVSKEELKACKGKKGKLGHKKAAKPA